MRITYIISLVSNLLLLNIEAVSHGFSHSDTYYNTTKTDYQEFNNIALSSSNYSFDSNDGNRILKVRDTNQTLAITRALQQDAKYTLTT